MLKTIAEFARQHILSTVIAAASVGFGGGATTLWSLYESKINRVEDMKVAEFNDLVSETKKFKGLLSDFTEEVGTEGKIDPAKRKDVSASLVRLYTSLDAFMVNVPPGKEPPVQRLQSSINEVRKRVQLMKKKQDLDPLAVALVTMFRDLKVAQPIIEEAVGKAFATES